MDAPLLKVEHPGPKTRRHLERLRALEPRAGLSFGLSPDGLVARRGAGAVIEDVDGNRYLDFVAGFGSLNAGHSHPRLVDAVTRQAALLQQAMAMSAEIRLDLAERVLAQISAPQPQRILFAASGSEAVEIALKLARRATGRQQVVAFSGAFHGRTQSALALMGRAAQRAGLGITTPGAYHIPYPYPLRNPFGPDPAETGRGTLALLDTALGDPTSGWEPPAAVIIEPVQGNGGMIPAPAGFLRGLRELCDRYGVLLVIDEVMSGFHRTGGLFAYLHEEGVQPDLLVLGKSLSAGLPLAACVASAAVADASPPGSETSTYAGNPVACAAALAALDVYEEEQLGDRARSLGEYFLDGLRGMAKRHEIVAEVRGKGLMVAVELASPDGGNKPLRLARAASERALRRGLLVYPGGHFDNVIAYLPPLVIDEHHIDVAIEITDQVLTEIAAVDPAERKTL